MRYQLLKCAYFFGGAPYILIIGPPAKPVYSADLRGLKWIQKLDYVAVVQAGREWGTWAGIIGEGVREEKILEMLKKQI